MQTDHVVCAFCGCVCDDICVTVENDRITQAKNACVLGRAWFLSHGEPSDLPVARIDGQAVTLDQGIDAAAQCLAKARYPFIYGLSSTSCEAQRKSVALAETLGGCIDCCTSVCHGPSGMALQGVGEPTCTLGEVLNRGDMIIFWGSNPAESHPRHFTKYSLMPKGMFLPNGRKDRTCVLVDVRKTKSAKAADIFIQIKPRCDFARRVFSHAEDQQVRLGIGQDGRFETVGPIVVMRHTPQTGFDAAENHRQSGERAAAKLRINHGSVIWPPTGDAALGVIVFATFVPRGGVV